MKNDPFVSAVKASGALPADEIDKILNFNKQDAYALLTHLIHSGLVPQRAALEQWASGLGVAAVDLAQSIFQPHVVARLPRDFAAKNRIVLMYEMAGVATAAMADPANAEVVRQAEKLAATKISPVFASMEEIDEAIELQYHTEQELTTSASKLNPELLQYKKDFNLDELARLGGVKGITQYARLLLILAVKERASDIHIEPRAGMVVVRFRIDGVLKEMAKLSMDIMPPLFSHLKVLGRMDITESRKPQDGRLSIDLGARSLSFRLSTIPTVYGEKMVLRKLGDIQKTNVPVLENLYLSRRTYDRVKGLISSPSGAFFVTGPTGSGKTTTLFAALQTLNTPEVNIVTVEDPVEYMLPGVSQVQVNHNIGLNFATALRSFLRQDPDVMLIGEIRDLETARIATEAALTGHLVLASMHTNDAIQAVTRLVDIGVEPFLVGPSLIGVMSQRLVRKLCEKCKVRRPLTAEEGRKYFFDAEGKQVDVFNKKGCPACYHTGYHGRLGIHEMVLVTERMRQMISASAPLSQIKEVALEAGYEPMAYDGIKKVLMGLTTFEEVESATFFEGM